MPHPPCHPSPPSSLLLSSLTTTLSELSGAGEHTIAAKNARFLEVDFSVRFPGFSLRRSEQRESPARFLWILLRGSRRFLRGGGVPWIPCHHRAPPCPPPPPQRSRKLTRKPFPLFQTARQRIDFCVFLFAIRHPRAAAVLRRAPRSTRSRTRHASVTTVVSSTRLARRRRARRRRRPRAAASAAMRPKRKSAARSRRSRPCPSASAGTRPCAGSRNSTRAASARALSRAPSPRTEPGLWWVVVSCGGLRWVAVAVGCGGFCGGGFQWVSVGFSGFQWASVGFSGFQ